MSSAATPFEPPKERAWREKKGVRVVKSYLDTDERDRVNLFVANEDRLFCDALSLALTSGDATWNVVCSSSVEGLLEHEPDSASVNIFLISNRLADSFGVPDALNIREKFNEAFVAVYGVDTYPVTIVDVAIKAGIVAFIGHDMSVKSFEAVLKLMKNGGSYFPFKNASESFGHFSNMNELQKQILSMVARGNSNKAIAKSLKISEAQVKSSVRTIGRKMGVKTRTQISHIYAKNQNLPMYPVL